MGDLEYIKETHKYFKDGVELPSVTTVLKHAGIIDTSSPWYTEAARDKGTYVHDATQFYDEGDLDIDTLDPALTGYLEAWLRFKSESGIEIIDTERKVCNDIHGYAGTLDRNVLWDVPTIIDIKAGQPESWHCLQTAAYAMCVPGTIGRATVYLSGDGKYKVRTHDGFSDITIFLSALAVVKWKKGNK